MSVFHFILKFRSLRANKPHKRIFTLTPACFFYIFFFCFSELNETTLAHLTRWKLGVLFLLTIHSDVLGAQTCPPGGEKGSKTSTRHVRSTSVPFEKKLRFSPPSFPMHVVLIFLHSDKKCVFYRSLLV